LAFNFSAQLQHVRETVHIELGVPVKAIDRIGDIIIGANRNVRREFYLINREPGWPPPYCRDLAAIDDLQ